MLLLRPTPPQQRSLERDVALHALDDEAVERLAHARQLLVTAPDGGKPGGFGLRNYWAGSVYNALKKQGKYLTK